MKNEFIPNFEKEENKDESTLTLPILPDVLNPNVAHDILNRIKMFFSEHEPYTEQLLQDIKNLEVIDENTFNLMSEYGTRCGLILKKYEKGRKILVDKPKDFTGRIDKLVRDGKKNPEAGKNLAKQKCDAYQTKKRREAEEARRKAEEEARKAAEKAAASGKPIKQESPVEQPAKFHSSNVKIDTGSASTTTVWKATAVIDIKQVPDEYLNDLRVTEIILKIANADVKNGRHVIPGIKVEEIVETTFRAKR